MDIIGGSSINFKNWISYILQSIGGIKENIFINKAHIHIAKAFYYAAKKRKKVIYGHIKPYKEAYFLMKKYFSNRYDRGVRAFKNYIYDKSKQYLKNNYELLEKKYNKDFKL